MEYLATIVVRVEADNDEGAQREAEAIAGFLCDEAETSCAWVDHVEPNPEGQ